VLIALAVARAQTGDSDAAYARAVRLQQAGDLAGAREAYKQALKLSPQRVDALSNLGLVYAGLHQYTAAVEAFRSALKLAPGHPIVLYDLGLTCLQAGRYEEARGALAQVVAAADTNYTARHYLGVALLKLGRTRQGIRELEQVMHAQPENLDAACTLASAYIREKQLDKAEILIRRILKERDTAEAHLLAGSFYLTSLKYMEALEELRRAQEMDPDLPGVQPQLGESYALTGSRQMAIRIFEAQLKSDPANFDALASLGWLYLDADRTEEAEQLLTKARRMKPDNTDVLFQLARLARQQEKLEEAAALLERIIALQPAHTRAHVLLSQTYFRLNRREDSLREQEIVKRLSERERQKRPRE